MIDRCIRPLFSKDIKNEVQVIITVMSFDQENDSDVIALIGASTALAMSDIPWGGPLAGVRMGQVDGQWVVNPSFSERLKSDLDLIVAGMNDKVLMIEAEGLQVSEDVVYGAIANSNQPINKAD